MSLETNEPTENTNPGEGNTLKGYRNLNDVENFYRFVYENKVRKEAQMIFKAIVDTLAPKKKTRKPRAKKQ